MFAQCFRDPDSDASKRKSFTTEQKKKDEDSGDDGVPLRKKLIRKKSLNKSNIPSEEEEDEDGGRVIRTYHDIKRIAVRPSLNPANRNVTSTSDTTVNGTIQSSTSLTVASSTSVDQKVPEGSANHPNPSRLNSRKAFTNRLYILRTKSYEKAQQLSLPIISSISDNAFSALNENNATDPENSYSEIVLASIDHLVSSTNHANTKQTSTTSIQQMRGKRARTRWHLAYTLIRNPSLRELRRRDSSESPAAQKPETTGKHLKSKTSRTKSVIIFHHSNKEIFHRDFFPRTKPKTPSSTIPQTDKTTQRPIERNIPIPSPISRPTFYTESLEQTSTIEMREENLNFSRHYTRTTYKRQIETCHQSE